MIQQLITNMDGKGLILPNKLEKLSAAMVYWPLSLPSTLKTLEMYIHYSPQYEPINKQMPIFNEGLEELVMPFWYKSKSNKTIMFPRSLKFLDWLYYGSATYYGTDIDPKCLPDIMVSKNTKVIINSKYRHKIKRYKPKVIKPKVIKPQV